MVLSSRASWPFPVIVLAIGPKKVEFRLIGEPDLLPVLHSPMLVSPCEGQAKFAMSGREHGFFA